LKKYSLGYTLGYIIIIDIITITTIIIIEVIVITIIINRVIYRGLGHE